MRVHVGMHACMHACTHARTRAVHNAGAYVTTRCVVFRTSKPFARASSTNANALPSSECFAHALHSTHAVAHETVGTAPPRAVCSAATADRVRQLEADASMWRTWRARHRFGRRAGNPTFEVHRTSKAHLGAERAEPVMIRRTL